MDEVSRYRVNEAERNSSECKCRIENMLSLDIFLGRNESLKFDQLDLGLINPRK